MFKANTIDDKPENKKIKMKSICNPILRFEYNMKFYQPAAVLGSIEFFSLLLINAHFS